MEQPRLAARLCSDGGRRRRADGAPARPRRGGGVCPSSRGILRHAGGHRHPVYYCGVDMQKAVRAPLRAIDMTAKKSCGGGRNSRRTCLCVAYAKHMPQYQSHF